MGISHRLSEDCLLYTSFDLELAETVPTSEITRRLDAVMVEGVHVLSTRQVEDGKAGKAMSVSYTHLDVYKRQA